jgi:hypothetical protein
MKKLVLLGLLAVLIALPAVAQDLAQFETAFAAFATEAANSLPFNALIGQNWSTAFIGKFPHLGAGVTLGATTIPFAAATPVLDMLAISLPAEFDFLNDYGMPIPAYTIDARLGLPFLPMDAGVKFGYLPEEAQALLPAGITLDYMLAGGDVRFALLDGKGLKPAVSIGAGVSYLQGSFGLAGLFGADQTITDVAGANITLSDPSVAFNWQTTVIDLKAQLSKSLLILEPYVGAGTSYGTSSAGGGLESEVLYNGSPITQADIDAVNAALGENAPDLSNTGLLVASEAGGWALRAYAGVSLKLAIIYMDLNAMYNFTSGAYGASLNLRLQL